MANVIAATATSRRWSSPTTRRWLPNCAAEVPVTSFRRTRSGTLSSYYDYYQPEAYIRRPSVYRKDSSINFDGSIGMRDASRRSSGKTSSSLASVSMHLKPGVAKGLQSATITKTHRGGGPRIHPAAPGPTYSSSAPSRCWAGDGSDCEGDSQIFPVDERENP